MTDAKPSMVQQLANAAAAAVVAQQDPEAVRDFVRKVNNDERVACQFGRITAGAIAEWLRRPQQ
jgi:methionyl-tRNA formyltransferase